MAETTAAPRTVGEILDDCVDRLATLMTALEGMGDEELYEHAVAAYLGAWRVRGALLGERQRP